MSKPDPAVVQRRAGVNKTAMIASIATTLAGVLLILTGALLPLGLVVVVAGGVWMAVVLAVRNKKPADG